MIFVTVGTHEQPFNRLVEHIDNMKRDGKITEDVFIQSGYSTYEPKYCKYEKLISYDTMLSCVKNARIVITHGGPASFMLSLQHGKIPIVVPRQRKFGEHVNDHQVEFSTALKERRNNIIVVRNINEIEKILRDYETITTLMKSNIEAANLEFNTLFKEIIKTIF